MRILVAESGERDARRLSSILRAQGYAVDRVKNDREAQLALTTARYALVVLNMMLPCGSSLDLLVGVIVSKSL